MAILSWGKGLLETTPCVDGAPAAESPVWTAIDTPKEGTLKLTATAGQETTATEEGGDVVDSRTGKTTYQLEFELFVKKGIARPFTDNDGVITGEHAWRYTPEDETTEGFLIERSSVRVEESFETAQGKMLKYVARCLKPKAGKTVKEYTKSAS